MTLKEALKLYEGQEGVKEIKTLIKKGINARYFKKKNIKRDKKIMENAHLIHIAESLGHKEIIEELEDIGNDFFQNMYPIHIAARFGYKEIVEALIENGADIDIKDGEGNTALATAFNCEWIERVSDFVEDFFDTKSDDINTKYEEIIYMLIEKGANVNVEYQRGYTPLMLASIFGDIKMVEILINNGADIDATYGDYGETSLIFSIIYKHIEIASMLIERGADINFTVGYHRKNALMYAIESKNYAIKSKNIEIISMLIERGIDINAQDNDGWTALMYASDKLDKDIVSILIKNGADINIKDNSGWTVKGAVGNRMIIRMNLK